MRLASGRIWVSFCAVLIASASDPAENMASSETASVSPEHITISLDSPVRFQAPDGTDVQVPAGSYHVKIATDTALQLQPAYSSETPLTIHGAPIDLEQHLPESVAIVLGAHDNQRHVVMLSPQGRGVEAVGMVGDVAPRAILGVASPADRELAILTSGFLQRAGALPTPVLSSPAEDTVLAGPDVQFAWTAGAGTPQSVSYKVCVVEEGQTCTSQRAWSSPGVGQPSLTATTLRATLPASLYQGKRLTWSVVVCPLLSASGPQATVVDLCGYSRPRHLTWTLPAPILGSPSNQTTLTGLRPTMSVRPVEGAGTYLFCISQPGITCPAASSMTASTVVAQVSAYYTQWTPGQDLSQFTGQAVHWTAGACNTFIGCVYQQNVREVTFPPTMVPVYLRLNSQFDVNEVRIVRGGGPGHPRVEEANIRDLFPWTGQDDLNSRSGGGTAPSHRTEVRLLLPKRHNPGQEPRVPDYYHLEYMEEQAGHAPGHLSYLQRDGVSFAPGVSYGPQYAIVRETLFLFGSNSYPRSRHELVLRGSDGQLYVFRPYCGGLQAGVAPPEFRDGCDGPVLLETLVSRGYNVYTAAQLGQ